MNYLDHLSADSRAIVEAAVGNLDRPVAACPDWNVEALVGHVGEVHRFWGGVVESRRTDEPDHDAPPVEIPGRMVLLEWFLAGARDLRDTLAAADPADAVWTWFLPQRTVDFVRRRMAQETAVHRWDVQHAVGAHRPIDAALAADGLDEFLTVFLPATRQWSGRGYSGARGTVHLHCTDVEGEWLVDLRDGDPVVRPGHERADTALRGPASDLLLVLWGRLPVSAVETHGDPVLATDLIAYVDTT